MHKCFGWLGSWDVCVGGCYGGFSSRIGELRKLCGVEPEVDRELLNTAQKESEKIERKEEPLQRLL